MTTVKMYDYQQGMDPISEIGLSRPFGDNVLVRAILTTDLSEKKPGGGIIGVSYSSSQAEAFEIIAVGGAVAKWCKDNGESVPEPGMHCVIKSTAADKLSSSDPAGRFWSVPVSDIAELHPWVPADHPGLADAIARVKERQAYSAAAKAAEPNMGQVDLEAMRGRR